MLGSRVPVLTELYIELIDLKFISLVGLTIGGLIFKISLVPAIFL